MANHTSQLLCPRCGNLSVNELACDVCGLFLPHSMVGALTDSQHEQGASASVQEPELRHFPALTSAAVGLGIAALLTGLWFARYQFSSGSTSTGKSETKPKDTRSSPALIAEEGPKHSLTIHVRPTPSLDKAKTGTSVGILDYVSAGLKLVSQPGAQSQGQHQSRTQLEFAAPAKPSGPAVVSTAQSQKAILTLTAATNRTSAEVIELGEEMFRTGAANRQGDFSGGVSARESAPAPEDLIRSEVGPASPTGRVLEISGGEFTHQVLAQPSGPVLVDFYATWCGPCKRLAPSVEHIASEFGAQLKVVRVDVDANPEVTRRYNVHAFPTLILFKSGRELNRTMGVVPIEAIRENVQRLL